MRCACCGKSGPLTRDHVIPKVWGGTLNYKQMLCAECNANKGCLIIDYNTKTMELQPYMFGLNERGRVELFGDTAIFSTKLFDPYYKKKFKQNYVK